METQESPSDQSIGRVSEGLIIILDVRTEESYT